MGILNSSPSRWQKWNERVCDANWRVFSPPTFNACFLRCCLRRRSGSLPVCVCVCVFVDLQRALLAASPTVLLVAVVEGTIVVVVDGDDDKQDAAALGCRIAHTKERGRADCDCNWQPQQQQDVRSCRSAALLGSI